MPRGPARWSESSLNCQPPGAVGRHLSTPGQTTLAPVRCGQANSRVMNLAIALPLIVALACALYAMRRISRRRMLRRQKQRRARNEQTGPRSFAPAKSQRSEMRTDDDPTTVMERITETKPPASKPGRNSK